MEQRGTAVCVLRVERCPEQTLITMTVTEDIAADDGSVVRRFADPAAAVAAVAAFLGARPASP